MKRRHAASNPLRSAVDAADAVRRLAPLDITAAIAAGADPISAAFDAARAHPTVAAGDEAARAVGRVAGYPAGPDAAIAMCNAVANLVARTARAHAQRAAAPF